MTLRICEIFSSLQGESTLAGSPCTFVRLAGCNLRCGYCDTQYAYESGREMAVSEIMTAVDAAGISLVEITGGEPLLQENVYGLMENLLRKDYRVMIETNGSVPVSGVDSRVMLVVDVKTPGSGEPDSFRLENLGYLKPVDNVKFVLTSEDDYHWAVDFMTLHSLASTCTVLFSAAQGRLLLSDLAAWMVRDRLPARLNLQIHKVIWSPETRGV